MVESASRVVQTRKKARLQAAREDAQKQQEESDAIPVPAPKVAGRVKKTHQAPAGLKVSVKDTCQCITILTDTLYCVGKHICFHFSIHAYISVIAQVAFVQFQQTS